MPKRLLAACALLCLTACSLLAPKFEKPTLSVVSVRLLGGNLMQQTFLATFAIQNPNARALPVSGLHAELAVGGEAIAAGVTNRPFLVPAGGETEFDMTITANLAASIFKLLKKLGPDADSLEYQLTGAASIDLPFLRDLPFHQNGTLALKGDNVTR